jgi:hypothetical protein
MKNELEIECALAEEIEHLDDPNFPMDELNWANNQGWIEALEWVLERKQMGGDPKDITHLLEGANNDTIKRAHKRLAKELGFGRKDNDVDSEDDSIRDGLLYGPQECFT